MENKIDISSIKSKFEYEDTFSDEEKKKFKLIRNQSIRDSIKFADLFITAYYTFKNNLPLIDDSDFAEFLDGFKEKANDLRVCLEDFDPEEINSHYSEGKIRSKIDRDEMDVLVGYFFQVFVSVGGLNLS